MKGLYNKEWRDYVDDDTQLVFDLDTFAYMAASAQEDSVMKVVQISTGLEVFKEKDVEIFERVCINPESLEEGYTGVKSPRYDKVATGKFKNTVFKNKSEFWGRKKKALGGYLGDLNTKREADGKTLFTREDFELTTTQVARSEHSVGFAINSLKDKIKQVTTHLGIPNTRFKYILGGGDNHRHDLPLPVNPNKPDILEDGRYKGQRGEKPLALEEVREYIVHQLGGKDYSGKGIEADDVINFMALESHKQYLKTGKHKYLIVSLDKDIYSFNGFYFNYYRCSKTKNWKHPVPTLVEGLGILDMVDGEVKGRGLLFFLVQITLGDAADNYYPTRHAKIKFGDKMAYNLLHDSTSPKDAIVRVLDQYHEWYPEGTTFTNWRGEETTMTTIEWLETMFTAAYMLKSYEDKTTFADYMKYVGINYDHYLVDYEARMEDKGKDDD